MPVSTPIYNFFESYGYGYNPNRETMAQFWHLCDERGWGKFDSEKKEALNNLRDAMAIQFNLFYGTDEHDPGVWEKFFTQLRVEKIPATLKECKDLSQTIYVNICDLVDHSIKRKSIQIFKTSEELAKYSRSKGKIFPVKQASAGELLKFLLRSMVGTYEGNKTSRGLEGGHEARPGGRGRCCNNFNKLTSEVPNMETGGVQTTRTVKSHRRKIKSSMRRSSFDNDIVLLLK
ncbi:hypothetical protein DL96DRAFT_272414 [Flagelloscypha sp. PMI_526]|nr:hypothetical protein DL96DRAFT_272414 [Flagelloscypha sp. PMI_526]